MLRDRGDSQGGGLPSLRAQSSLEEFKSINGGDPRGGRAGETHAKRTWSLFGRKTRKEEEESDKEKNSVLEKKLESIADGIIKALTGTDWDALELDPIMRPPEKAVRLLICQLADVPEVMADIASYGEVSLTRAVVSHVVRPELERRYIKTKMNPLVKAIPVLEEWCGQMETRLGLFVSDQDFINSPEFRQDWVHILAVMNSFLSDRLTDPTARVRYLVGQTKGMKSAEGDKSVHEMLVEIQDAYAGDSPADSKEEFDGAAFNREDSDKGPHEGYN